MGIAQLEAASRAASIQPDTSMARLQLQLDADEKKTNQQMALDGRNTLTNLRNDGTDKIFRIQTSDMSPERKQEAIDNVVDMTNKSLGNQATYLGITPDSWLLTKRTTTTSEPSPGPAPTTIPDGDGGGGAGGPQ